MSNLRQIGLSATHSPTLPCGKPGFSEPMIF